MRRAMTALSFGLCLSACKAPPQDKMLAGFTQELHLYFNNLNDEALTRKQLLAAESAEYRKNPGLPPPTGIQFNTFTFSEKGYIAYDVRCKRPTCGQAYLVVDYYGLERKCARCGEVLIPDPDPKKENKPVDMVSWLKEKCGADVKPMFEPTHKDTSKLPLKAIVRYVRRNWVYDPRGKPDIDLARIPEKSAWKPQIKMAYLPGAAESKIPPGFHRPDATYVAEQEFQFDGSTLKPIGQPREDFLRPWSEIWDVRRELESSR